MDSDYGYTKIIKERKWGGKYLEISFLGEGAEAKVYKVEHDNQIYALKCLKTQQEFDKDQQFQRQIKDFSNILKRIDSFNEESDGENKFCIIYEYCPQTLAQKIKLGMNEEEVIDFLIQFCNGYKNLYQQGILHRDIKPENILISCDGKYKIADFGLSRRTIDPGQKNIMTKSFTPYYASPEIFHEEYSAKTDMYSFGLTLFECMHEHPFKKCQSIKQIKLLQKQFENQLQLKDNQSIIKYQDPELQQILIQSLKSEQNERLSWEDLFANPLITQRTHRKENPNDADSFKGSSYFINRFENFQIFKDLLEKETNFDKQYTLLKLWEKQIETLHKQLQGKIKINNLDISLQEFQKSKNALLLSDVLIVIGKQVKEQLEFYFKLKDQRNTKIHMMYNIVIDEVLDVQKMIDSLKLVDQNKEQQLRNLFNN